MPIIHPEELVGRTFGITQEDGQTTQLRIIEAIKEHQDNIESSSTNVKFRCGVNNDAYEDILTYNQIMDYLSKDDEDDIIWKFKDIIGHQGPLNKNHKDYKGSPYNLTVLWENGETTNEPLSVIAADNPVSCAMYAKKYDLLDLPGWKRFKSLAKRQNNMLREVNLAKLRKHTVRTKFKYGCKVPKDFKHTVYINQRNGNTL